MIKIKYKIFKKGGDSIMGGKEVNKGTAITLRGKPIVKNGFVVGYGSVKTVVFGLPGTEVYFSDAKKAVAESKRIPR